MKVYHQYLVYGTRVPHDDESSDCGQDLMVMGLAYLIHGSGATVNANAIPMSFRVEIYIHMEYYTSCPLHREAAQTRLAASEAKKRQVGKAGYIDAGTERSRSVAGTDAENSRSMGWTEGGIEGSGSGGESGSGARSGLSSGVNI